MMIVFCLNWSHVQFIQLLSAVCPLTVSIQRLLGNLAACMTLFTSFAVTFSIIFFNVINYGKVKCVEFSSAIVRVHSTFRILVSMIDFRSFEVENDVSLDTAHVLYVAMGPIMLINYLIGTFSAIVIWVNSHEDIVLTVLRLRMMTVLEKKTERCRQIIHKISIALFHN